MQARNLSPADAAAVFAYILAGKPTRVFARGASAINPETGKADRCPLPIATRRFPVAQPVTD